MNRVVTMLIAGTFAASLGACDKAEAPAETQADVAEAQAEATENVAEAQADMNEDVREGEEETALAQAHGTHKVAIEKCDALPASQQKPCKDLADADYDAAKAAADLPGPS